MRMWGQPKSHLHDVAGAIISVVRQTPLTQRQEDLALFTGALGNAKRNVSVERNTTYFFLS